MSTLLALALFSLLSPPRPIIITHTHPSPTHHQHPFSLARFLRPARAGEHPECSNCCARTPCRPACAGVVCSSQCLSSSNAAWRLKSCPIHVFRPLTAHHHNHQGAHPPSPAMSDSAFAAALDARDDESSDEESEADNVVICDIHRLLVPSRLVHTLSFSQFVFRMGKRLTLTRSRSPATAVFLFSFSLGLALSLSPSFFLFLTPWSVFQDGSVI